MTPGNASRVHPARRRLVGIVIGVGARATEVEARVAIYASRTSSEPLAEVTITYPKAGAFEPTLGTRLAVTLEPIE